MESVENDKILRVTTCKTIEELCIFGELSLYTNQKKLICDICDDDSSGEIKRSGEFSYDCEAEGKNFTQTNMPRKFWNLKSHAAGHLKSSIHIKAKSNKDKRDKEDEECDTYNYKIGMKQGKIVYNNIKERESYAKYSRDVAHRTSNGEDLGNINHGDDFAKDLVDAMAEKARIELTKYFCTVLPCTDENLRIWGVKFNPWKYY